MNAGLCLLIQVSFMSEYGQPPAKIYYEIKDVSYNQWHHKIEEI
jgi:hypothetical protein